MFKIPFADIKEKIVASGKLGREEFENKVKAKISELSGLISEEGAAHIIANELGVELVPQNGNKLKIKEVYAGMKNISTLGKVVRKFDVREFAKGDSTGKVCSIVLGDETGTMRVVFWNDQVDLLKEVKEDDVLQVVNAYVRDNRGTAEIHLGDKGDIVVNPEGETVNVVRSTLTAARKSIKELAGGEQGVELLGTVVQVFDPRFWNVCPRCNRKVMPEGEVYKCNDHGEVTPGFSYVMNVVLDDSSGTIRGVFWKNQTLTLLGKSDDDLVAYKDNPASFEDVKTDLLGEQFKLTGRVQKNQMFDRLEFVAQVVEKADPAAEISRLESNSG